MTGVVGGSLEKLGQKKWIVRELSGGEGGKSFPSAKQQQQFICTSCHPTLLPYCPLASLPTAKTIMVTTFATAHQKSFCCCRCCFHNRCSTEKPRTWKLLRKSGNDETKSENWWSRKRYNTNTLAYVLVHFILESLSTCSSEDSTEGYVSRTNLPFLKQNQQKLWNEDLA